MALGSANAVSPAPAVDNTVKANPSVATTGNGAGGTFTDSLDAVLAPDANTKTSAKNDNDAHGASAGHGKLSKLKNKLMGGDAGLALTPQQLQQQQAIIHKLGGTFTDSLDAVLAPDANAKTSAKNDNDAHGASTGHGKLSELKNKLMGGDAGIALTPQQLQQQQAIIHKLGATNTGIDIPALRAALGNSGQIPGKIHTLPVLNPVTGKVSAAQTNLPANGAAASAFNATASAPTVANKASTQAAPVANGTDPSKTAAQAATQEKLVAGLLKTARSPVLKDGQADGSKVPNAKISHPAHPQKTASNAAGAETVQSLAVEITATAGATNSAGTAQIAAKDVAVAEVATRTTAATPTVTKIETAAMANATQTATHTPTPQAKIEAQALPIQFDAASTNSKDGDADPKNGSGDKSGGQAANARTANDASRQTEAPAPNLPSTQPAAPAHADTTPANTNLAAAANTQVAAPTTMSPQVAATLHVSQQSQPDATADQTAFAALGVAIAAKSKDGEKQFDINMHPADLGKIDVRISVDADGQAQAHLTAEHPQTLQLLKQDQTTLAQNLRDAGLNLANNGLNFSLKGEQQPSTPTFNARSRALSISAIQTVDVSPTISHANLAPGDARLDIRV